MVDVGQLFSEERQKRGLTLADVSKATKIRESFLQAIENGQYQKLPSSAYATGFVRNYAKFLGFPEQKTLAIFRREFNTEKFYKVLPENFAKEERYQTKSFKVSQSMGSIILAFLLLLGYLIFQYRYAFLPPPLDITRPKEMSVITTSNVVVEGKTDANAAVFVNDNSVAVDSDGSFKKTITLFSGKNTITVKVINRFGKEKIIQRHIDIKTPS